MILRSYLVDVPAIMQQAAASSNMYSDAMHLNIPVSLLAATDADTMHAAEY